MAGKVDIVPGTKLRMAYDVEIGQQPEFNMICTFARAQDESVFLVSVPMGADGLPIEIDENRKLIMRYGAGAQAFIMSGYADDLVHEEYRAFWKIRRVSERRQFFKRADERVKATIRVQYTNDMWDQLPDGTTPFMNAITLDISAGGAAIFLGTRFEVGEVIHLNFPHVGSGLGSDGINGATAVVSWYREAPKGSNYPLICGLQYRFEDGLEKERMKIYVANAKSKLKA